MRLRRALKEKRPPYEQRHDKVILLHDKAWPHAAKPVKTYLETTKWDVLTNPLYSLDIAPSDYHLFRSMANGLAEQRFHSYDDTKKMGRFLESLKRRIVLPTWNSYTARKMGESGLQ